jgi:hypothetical protein
VGEERASGRRSKLHGVMKLQTGISELGRYFWPNGLPQLWGGPPSLVRLVRNQFHKISLMTTSSAYPDGCAATSGTLVTAHPYGLCHDNLLAEHIQS